MAALPYMQLYPADYLADTAHLTTEEHGAYLLLLMTYWQTGKALPNDERKLSRIARMSSEGWENVKENVLEFFDLDGECLVHGRIEKDLDAVLSKSKKTSDAGKASAEARKELRNAKKARKANRSPTYVEQTLNICSADVQQNVNHTDTDTDKRKGKEIAPSKSDALVSNPDSELQSRIKEAFLSRNGNNFTDWPKEIQGIKGIIKKARERSPEDPEGLIRQQLNTFWKKKSAGEKYWIEIPFLPSKLNCSANWDSLLETTRADSEPNIVAQLLGVQM